MKKLLLIIFALIISGTPPLKAEPLKANIEKTQNIKEYAKTILKEIPKNLDLSFVTPEEQVYQGLYTVITNNNEGYIVYSYYDLDHPDVQYSIEYPKRNIAFYYSLLMKGLFLIELDDPVSGVSKRYRYPSGKLVSISFTKDGVDYVYTIKGKLLAYWPDNNGYKSNGKKRYTRQRETTFKSLKRFN